MDQANRRLSIDKSQDGPYLTREARVVARIISSRGSWMAWPSYRSGTPLVGAGLRDGLVDQPRLSHFAESDKEGTPP